LVGDLRGLAPPIAAFDPHGSDLPRTGNPARRDEGSH
jgi:hypothetical protein